MGTNQILEFAGDPGASVQDYSTYYADAQRTIGNQPGLARSVFVNKVLQQTSKMAAVLAQFIVNESGEDVLDTDSSSEILANLISAIEAAALGTSVKTGMVIPNPVSTLPSGYLECNGAAVSKITYAALYDYLKDGGVACIYGESGGNFYLPDYRGKFLRGWDHGAGNDPNAATRTNRGDTVTGDFVGTKQADEFKEHHHVPADVAGYNDYSGPTGGLSSAGTGYSDATASSGNTGGDETRPKNVNVMWIIKT